MESRAMGASVYGTSFHGEHEEAIARDRWRNELEERMSAFGNTQPLGTGFASTTAIWDQGPPTSPHGGEIAREDIKGVAQAIMGRAGTGDSLLVATMGQNLQNSPYGDFAAWFDAAVDMEGADSLSMNQLEAVVGQYLQESAESNVAKALHAGGPADSPFVDGNYAQSQATPNENAVGTRAGDLVSFIQQSKHREATSPSKASKPLGKVMLHMTVEIGDGRSDTIDVREGDEPRALADAFCRYHDLSVNVVEPLADHIKANIAQIRAPLESPKKVPQPSPSPSAGSSPAKSKKRVNGAEVGRRLTETPTRLPRASMDPSSRMMPASASGEDGWMRVYQETGTIDPDHIDELAMSPSTTNAVRRHITEKNANSKKASMVPTPLKEKTHQTADRMRAARGKKSRDVCQKLYKEAATRQQKRETDIEQKMLDDEKKIADEIKRERQLAGRNNKNAQQDYGEQRDDVGDRLYKQGIEKRNEHKAKCEAAAKKKMEDEVAATVREIPGKPGQTTKAKIKVGKPLITNKAKSMQSRVLKDWDGTERKKRLDELRKQQAGDEMAECTFDIKTTIQNSEEMGYGSRSEKLVQKMVNDAGQEEGNRFEVLYQDAKYRQLRTEQYENWFPQDETFHPDIGANKYRPSNDASEEDFINRLTYSKQMTPAAELQDRDVQTGQPLFHPRTGRAPLFNRNAADLPIGDYLYASGLELEDEKERRRFEAEQDMVETVNESKVSMNSQLLSEGMRRRRLREVFEMIDTDADGIIDPDSANAAGVEGLLPEDIANEVIPVVVGTGQPLTFEQFYQLASTEIAYTQTGPRQYLVPERLRHLRALEDYIMSKEGAPYNPKVSIKSKNLAEKTRKHRHGSLHDALSEEGQIWDERRRNASEQKAAADLADCTFMPNAHLSRVSARGTPNPDEVTRRLSQPARRG
jgi:hypothetical protein